MHVLADHWALVSAVCLLVVNLCNALTPHFDNYKGVKRWLMVVVDVLSVLASTDSYKTWKPPLVRDRRRP